MIYAAGVLEEHSKESHVAPVFIGLMYEQSGNVEKAIDWYEIAFEKRDPDAPYLGVITKNTELHGHPRFIRLLQDMQHFYWAGLYAKDSVTN